MFVLRTKTGRGDLGGLALDEVVDKLLADVRENVSEWDRESYS